MNFPEIPGFAIIEKFPRGGMSHVYKARQISLDRVVVIKTLPPNQKSQYSDVKQFMFEARIAANLKHPNIVQVYDFGRCEELYYFVMEYVSGYSVADWIHRKGKISEQDSLILAEIVAKALDHAWSKARVVHCDIKPDNIMIDSDGTVKVADLGLAKSFKSMARTADPAEAELVTGTPNYISPEQSRGDPDIDFRADMYSMGAMLYHMLTGVMPFHDMSPIKAMDAQISDQLDDPQDINPHISTPAAYFIEKLMAKNKEDRYSDWSRVVADIAKVSAKQMPSFLPEKVASTVKRGERRKYHRPSPNILSASVKDTKKDGPSLKKPVPVKRSKFLVFKKNPVRTAIGLGAAIFVGVALTLGLVLIRTGKEDAGEYASIGKAKPVSARVAKAEAEAERKRLEEEAAALRQEEARRKQEEEARLAQEEAARRMEMEARAKEARDEYQRALDWWSNNPDKYAQAIRNFQQVAQKTTGSKYAELAAEQAGKIEVARRDAVDAVLAELKKQADQLVSEEKYLQAAALYKNYDGVLAFETSDTRNFFAENIEQRHVQRVQERKRQAEQARKAFNNLKAEIARKCLEPDIHAAKQLLEQARKKREFDFNRQAIEELYQILSEASGARQQIIQSFQEQVGTETHVSLKSGKQELSINEVYDERIEAERIVRTESGELRARLSFSLDDLSLEEKNARLGPVTTPGAALARAVMILDENNDINGAEKYFMETGPHLRQVFQEQIVRVQSDKLNAEAVNFLGRLCKHLGVTADISNPDEVFAALASKQQYSAQEIETCTKFVNVVENKYSETEFSRKYARVLRFLGNLARRRGH